VRFAPKWLWPTKQSKQQTQKRPGEIRAFFT
jgi:hypothetical protein